MGMSPWPVRKMMGSSLPFVVRASCSSKPFKPGIATSSTRQPEALGSYRSRNSQGELNVATVKPGRAQQAREAFQTAGRRPR